MSHVESLMLKSPRDNPMLNAALSMCEELIKSGSKKHVLLFNARRQQCPNSLATMPSPPRVREEGSSVCSSLVGVLRSGVWCCVWALDCALCLVTPTSSNFRFTFVFDLLPRSKINKCRTFSIWRPIDNA